MKKNLFPIAAGVFSMLFMASCESERPTIGGGTDPNPDPTPTNEISKWVYNQMQESYLWEVPTNIDKDLGPEAYFAKAKSSDDYISGIYKTADLVASAQDIGFEYAINEYGGDNKIYYVVYYVKPNTNAAQSGLKRGFLITKVNGTEPKTDAEAQTLLRDAYKDGNEVTLTVIVPNGVNALTLKVKPQVIATENPLFAAKDTTMGSNKVGYILYNNFTSGSNATYDNAVAAKLQEFANSGVNNMVLDLRYNDGGSLSTANVLASALVKGGSSSDVFFIHKRREGLEDMPVKFLEKTTGGMSIPKLGDKLSKLYIITGQTTGGASEVLINSLKAYWGNNLIIVGDKTQGEGYLSLSQGAKNEWTMFLAYSYLADKNGKFDYKNGFTPGILISEVNDDNVSTILGAFGTKGEVVYAKVLANINGTRSVAGENYSDTNKKLITSFQDKPFAGITLINPIESK